MTIALAHIARLMRSPLYRRLRCDGFRVRQQIRGDRARRGKRLLAHWLAVYSGVSVLGYEVRR